MPSRAPWSTPPWRGSSGTTPPGARTPAAAHAELDRCWNELQDDEEYVGARRSTATRPTPSWPTRGTLVDNYFRLEDPNEARAVGIELGVETVVDGMRLRGIIDRLDVRRDGSLIVVDYKTGRAPSERFERGSMGGVQTYALLVREPARAGARRGPAALPAPARSPFRRWPRSRPSAASAGAPSPSGPPLSGPATPRTSGPTSARCATTATSRPPAPPSPRERPQ